MKLLLIVFAILLVSEVDARSTKNKPRSQDKKKRAKKESKEEPEAKEKQTTPDPPVAPPAEQEQEFQDNKPSIYLVGLTDTCRKVEDNGFSVESAKSAGSFIWQKVEQDQVLFQTAVAVASLPVVWWVVTMLIRKPA